MAKYITRTIDTFNTKVTFVMNNQIKTIFNEDVIIVSCEKVV